MVDHDGRSSRKRKVNALPPPPDDEQSQSVTVPPLEPPPASLEAMVHSRRRPRSSSSEMSPWLWLAALFLLGMLVTMYFTR